MKDILDTFSVILLFAYSRDVLPTLLLHALRSAKRKVIDLNTRLNLDDAARKCFRRGGGVPSVEFVSNMIV